MTLLALALIFASAWAHALWNFWGKACGDKHAFFWCFILVGVVVYSPAAAYFLATRPLGPHAAVFCAGTAVLHVAYFQLLKYGYTIGDLSLVYPVSRGTGILLISGAGVFFLRERVTAPAVAAIATILAGLVVVNLRSGGAGGGARPALVSAAIGVLIAAYSVWDKVALRDVHPILLGYTSFLGQALFNAPFALARRDSLRREIARNWKVIVAAGVLAPASYWLILVALTFSRVSYIAPARELGIVIGVVLARVVLREPFSAPRLLGSCLIVAGVIALALAP
jgi:drug/metabolite transporter (DMT)-like permease